MARIRTIKPEFFKNSKLQESEVAAGLPLRLAFAGLWCCADRDGRFRWKPKELKLDCLPFDDVDFEAVMVALEKIDAIRSYVVDDRKFGYIPAWSEHQAINGREAPSVLPEPPRQNGPTVTAAPRDDDTTTTAAPRADDASATRRDAAHEEGKGREGKGKGREEEDASSTPPATSAGPEAGFSLSGEPKSAKVTGGSPVTLKTFFERCEAAHVDPIPEDDAVFTYSRKAGIPDDFIRLAWKEFRRKHVDTAKKYANWRQAFRNCVEGNWYKLWSIDRQGAYFLTAAGKQATKAHGG